MTTNPEKIVLLGDQSATLRGEFGEGPLEGTEPMSQQVIIDQMPMYTVSTYLPPCPGRKEMCDRAVPELA